MNYVEELEEQGVDLDNLDVNFREDYDSGAIRVNFASEDLYDEETNSVLHSIVLTETKDEE